MSSVDRRPAHDRARIPVTRLLIVWGAALAIGLTFLLVKSADREAREDAAADRAQSMADATASLVGAELRSGFERLSSTATALLSGEVDREVLDAAMPVTGLPLLAVLDVETTEVLAINLDVDVDGPQIVAWMPSIARALDGERSVGELAGLTDAPIVAFAVPFQAQDGSDRVLAVGTTLDQSRFPELLEAASEDVHVGIHSPDGTELLSNGIPDREGHRAISGAVDTAAWQVHVVGPLAAFDSNLASAWQDPRVLALVTFLVLGGLAAWATRALRDAATIEAAYGRLAWGARQQREFSALVSHELRTPATSASGLASFLTKQWDHLDVDRRRELAERVAHSTASLAELVQDLDLSTRLTDGILPLRPDNQQVVRLIDGALAHAELDRNRVTVRGDLDAVVDVDLRYAVRAIGGVLHNAAVHGGAPIEVSVAAVDSSVAIVIRDHGPGVPAAFRDLLFEPFTQAQSHLRRTHGGTGLGLHLVAAIIEQLGGRITHHDAAPGAAFSIHLPSKGQRRSTKTDPASSIRAST